MSLTCCSDGHFLDGLLPLCGLVVKIDWRVTIEEKKGQVNNMANVYLINKNGRSQAVVSTVQKAHRRLQEIAKVHQLDIVSHKDGSQTAKNCKGFRIEKVEVE